MYTAPLCTTQAYQSLIPAHETNLLICLKLVVNYENRMALQESRVYSFGIPGREGDVVAYGFTLMHVQRLDECRDIRVGDTESGKIGRHADIEEERAQTRYAFQGNIDRN